MFEYLEKLYKGSDRAFYENLETKLQERKKCLLVTANPEIFSRALENKELHQLLLDEQIMISPDGEGVVKAARRLDYQIWGKIAGVDTVAKMVEYCARHQLSVYCYGTRQEVLDALQSKWQQAYPELQIVGMKNGFDNKEDAVFEDMVKQQPDLILVALGVPKQELAVYHHLKQFQKGLFIGVGGSLDVLSGTKKRAPAILIKCKLEWLYRLMKEPKRIKKFYQTHVLFLFKIRKLKKQKTHDKK